MADGWYPAAIINRASTDGGTHAYRVEKGCLHTTESSGFTPRSDSYFGHSSYPHFTVEVEGGAFKAYQHISIRRAARALRNRTGGVETNREGVIQIEVVGRAADPFTDDPVMVKGLAKLMRWIESQTAIPAKAAAAFHPYPPDQGARLGREPWRMGGYAWTKATGWVGHQHVPENEHGDPGAIDIKRLLPQPAPAKTVAPKPAPAPQPAPTPAPAPAKKEIPTMIVVKDPDSPKQFVVDANAKRHLDLDERNALVGAGVPYLGDDTPAAQRRSVLAHRTEVAV